jgi:hypothetical protein
MLIGEELAETVSRTAEAAPCTCGGYADSVPVTPEEDRKYGCGRMGCCSVAFSCRLCGKRLVGSCEAPEMD